MIEKLNKINEIIELVKKKTSNINKEDIKNFESYYKWPDGTIFTAKMVEDFKMWKSFESNYVLNISGGYQLLRILLDRILNKENENDKITNDKFIQNYIEAYEKKNSINIKD